MISIDGKTILFIGGARSGKSALAEKIASNYSNVAYLATAKAIDKEMEERIKKHRNSRPSKWATFEVDGKLEDSLIEACKEAEAVIVDCLTIYVARRMEKTVDDDEIVNEVASAVKKAKSAGKTIMLVSNEVGLGIVPDYPVGRRYRDLMGTTNQKVAKLADHVLFTVAGLTVDIKAINVDFF